jgi:hypothetical protein
MKHAALHPRVRVEHAIHQRLIDRGGIALKETLDCGREMGAIPERRVDSFHLAGTKVRERDNGGLTRFAFE